MTAGDDQAPTGAETAADAIVASPANPRVKAVVRLRDRRERESTGLTVVHGLREIRLALRCGAAFEAAYIGPSVERGDGRAVEAELVESGVRLVRVSAAVEARLAFGDRVEGIVAVIRVPTLRLADLRVPPGPLVVILEHVEKPGNLGAVLRSVDGAGADALIAADPLADPWSPNAIRASIGTVFGVPTAVAPTSEVIDWCLARSLRLVAARVDAATLYSDADLTGGVAIVLGSEADGLGPAWDRGEVEAVRLPMHGMADSLNVSVAAAVLLYEARRQRDMQARAGRPTGAGRAVGSAGAGARARTSDHG